MTKVAIVGGGITGLSAARLLARSGVEVILFEAGARLGGKLAPVELGGVRFDGGAESVLARRPEAVDLISTVGLADRLVHPTNAKPRLLIDGRPTALPPSMMGVPSELDPLRTVLSVEGFNRAAGEPNEPAPPFTADVPIGAYVDRRFGPEVTDRLVEPLLGGVYAGDARALSFAAVAQDLFGRARAGGSLLEHARGSGRRPSDGPVFAGVRGGVHGIVGALVTELDTAGVEVRLGTPVQAIDGTRLIVGSAANPETIAVDGVLIAAPARTVSRLLGTTTLADLAYASVAVITLAVRGLEPDGSGLLVPRGGLPTVKALTHSSIKWDWVGEQAAEVWGDGAQVVRASIGRIGEIAALQVDDQTLVARTWAELTGRLPGWSRAELITSGVTRWGGALPQYAVGHLDQVAALRRGIQPRKGFAVAGAAFDGVGIAACLASASRAVSKIITDLGGVA